MTSHICVFIQYFNIYVYIYVCVYMYAYMNLMFIRVHLHTPSHTRMYICTRMHINRSHRQRSNVFLYTKISCRFSHPQSRFFFCSIPSKLSAAQRVCTASSALRKTSNIPIFMSFPAFLPATEMWYLAFVSINVYAYIHIHVPSPPLLRRLKCDYL